jgi:hypothetical protein
MKLWTKSPVRLKIYKGEKGGYQYYTKKKFQNDLHQIKIGNCYNSCNVVQKLYLSPIIDLFNQESSSYELTERPVFNQVVMMLKKAAFKKIQIY